MVTTRVLRRAKTVAPLFVVLVTMGGSAAHAEKKRQLELPPLEDAAGEEVYEPPAPSRVSTEKSSGKQNAEEAAPVARAAPAEQAVSSDEGEKKPTLYSTKSAKPIPAKQGSGFVWFGAVLVTLLALIFLLT